MKRCWLSFLLIRYIFILRKKQTALGPTDALIRIIINLFPPVFPLFVEVFLPALLTPVETSLGGGPNVITTFPRAVYSSIFATTVEGSCTQELLDCINMNYFRHTGWIISNYCFLKYTICVLSRGEKKPTWRLNPCNSRCIGGSQAITIMFTLSSLLRGTGSTFTASSLYTGTPAVVGWIRAEE